jgi:FkbM family methyltransferase
VEQDEVYYSSEHRFFKPGSVLGNCNMPILTSSSRLMKRAALLLDMLGMPGGVEALLWWRPRSLASFRIVSVLKRECGSFKMIIDGGANVGQFARAVTWAFPEAAVHCFEPQPEIAERLRTNLRDNPRLSVHECALGNTDGTTQFHRNYLSQTSSIFPLGIAHDGPYSERLKHVSTIQVPIRRLDNALRDVAWQRPALLKLDLQGFELEALRGAEELLERIDYILVESAFKEVYQGEPLFNDIHAFLSSKGFDLIRPLSFAQEPNGDILYTDTLFGKSAETR